MARQKNEVHKVTMTEGRRAIIHQLVQEYDIESQDAEACIFYHRIIKSYTML